MVGTATSGQVGELPWIGEPSFPRACQEVFEEWIWRCTIIWNIWFFDCKRNEVAMGMRLVQNRLTSTPTGIH